MAKLTVDIDGRFKLWIAQHCYWQDKGADINEDGSICFNRVLCVQPYLQKLIKETINQESIATIYNGEPVLEFEKEQEKSVVYILDILEKLENTLTIQYVEGKMDDWMWESWNSLSAENILYYEKKDTD